MCSKALGLILQAARARQPLGRDIPDTLDIGHDMVWDWRSMTLSENEYGAFAYAVVKYLRNIIDIVSYDWIPRTGTGQARGHPQRAQRVPFPKPR